MSGPGLVVLVILALAVLVDVAYALTHRNVKRAPARRRTQ